MVTVHLYDEFIFRQSPRLEDELACLNVEREPRDVDVAVSCREFVAGLPGAPAVLVHPDDIRMRSHLVQIGNLRADINQSINVKTFLTFLFWSRFLRFCVFLFSKRFFQFLKTLTKFNGFINNRILSSRPNYTVSQKTRHLTLAHNFTKYGPIFKILSLLDSVGNL